MDDEELFGRNGPPNFYIYLWKNIIGKYDVQFSEIKIKLVRNPNVNQK